MPSSRESSQSRDWAQVYRIAGMLLTLWATRRPVCIVEVPNVQYFNGLFQLLFLLSVKGSLWSFIHNKEIFDPFSRFIFPIQIFPLQVPVSALLLCWGPCLMKNTWLHMAAMLGTPSVAAEPWPTGPGLSGTMVTSPKLASSKWKSPEKTVFKDLTRYMCLQWIQQKGPCRVLFVLVFGNDSLWWQECYSWYHVHPWGKFKGTSWRTPSLLKSTAQLSFVMPGIFLGSYYDSSDKMILQTKTKWKFIWWLAFNILGHLLSNKEKEPVPGLLSCEVTPQSHLCLPPCALRKVKVKVAQSRLTSLQAHVHGILQARILEWVAFPFSRGSS